VTTEKTPACSATFPERTGCRRIPLERNRTVSERGKKKMKAWRLFITALLLSSLGTALGFGGCGGNDDFRRITPEEASRYFAENCGEDDVVAAVDGVNECIDDCLQGDRICEEACYNNIYYWAITQGLWCFVMYYILSYGDQ
jgi:hypothetical protein